MSLKNGSIITAAAGVAVHAAKVKQMWFTNTLRLAVMEESAGSRSHVVS